MKFSAEKLRALKDAVAGQSHVQGHTHNFYKYPARFSPEFARVAIESFSKNNDLVLDPYCGGGTTVVEAMLLNRRTVGNDLNSLATFVARAKTTPLTRADVAALEVWIDKCLPTFYYTKRITSPHEFDDSVSNMSIPRARFLKKIIGVALESLNKLPNPRVIRFMRCAILQTAQWALDGKKRHTTAQDFRERLAENVHTMCVAGVELKHAIEESGYTLSNRRLFNCDAAQLPTLPYFKQGNLVDLVVTSPPYPGVHMLYHRWQVDGRKETPAPYWIAGCSDGNGASFYTFGDIKQPSSDPYFARSLITLQAVRAVMKRGAHILQLIAFSNPSDHLPRYMQNMRDAGFKSVSTGNFVWRNVPNRKWHAVVRGKTASSREVLLIHRAS